MFKKVNIFIILVMVVNIMLLVKVGFILSCFMIIGNVVLVSVVVIILISIVKVIIMFNI